MVLLGLGLVRCLSMGNEMSMSELKRVVNQLLDSGRLDQAASILKEQRALKGESEEILFLEANLLFKQKRHQESLAKLRTCLEKKMETAEVYKLIASNAIVLDRMEIVKPALTVPLPWHPMTTSRIFIWECSITPPAVLLRPNRSC